MANRTFIQDAYGLIKKPVYLYPVISVGAAGAVTLKKRTFTAGGASSLSSSSSLGNAPTSGVGYAVGDGVGTRSVARTGTGLWTITLSDPYQYLLGVCMVSLSSATGLWTTPSIGVVSGSTTITTNTGVGNGGVISVVIQNGSGAATDPANGDTITLEIMLGDATEP